jgi:hypothetical protein
MTRGSDEHCRGANACDDGVSTAMVAIIDDAMAYLLDATMLVDVTAVPLAFNEIHQRPSTDLEIYVSSSIERETRI